MKNERYKAECRHFIDMMKTFSELLTVMVQINIVQDEINLKTYAQEQDPVAQD